jgi:SNF2 family DNA or RNA helicase
MLEETLESGLKVVVFSQYVSMLRLIERHLERLSVGFATIKGDTRDRGAMLRRFQNDEECRVFTASLRAGGVGIDLTAASVVIHYDRWWNQAREDQATDRVHRIGQNRGVQVIRLITRDTLEEKIDAMIRRKHELASDLVREDDPTLAKQFTRAELRELLEV